MTRGLRARAAWHFANAALLAAMLGCQGAAEVSEEPGAPERATLEQGLIDSSTTLGFESVSAWNVTGGNASSTPIRTQGDAGIAISSPKNLTFSATSAPVVSTAPQLAGLSNEGAFFLLDVLLPTQIGNVNNPGSIALSISSKSRRINNAYLGTVSFQGARLGTYRTVKFSIPEKIRAQLTAAAFTDLTFQISLSLPGRTTGTYLLDNLRARAFGLAEPRIGESVDLVAQLTDEGVNTPGHATFDAGVVQIPQRFHVKLGSAGTTGTAQLALGFGGTAFVTCTYTSALGGKAYDLTSCTGGFRAGDLIGASEATLTIISAGADGAKIRAQLALNPVGDVAGTGIIPPMPTWWGECEVEATHTCDADGGDAWCTVCDPTIAGTIATDYFALVAQSPPIGLTVKAPPGEFALHLGDGSAFDNLDGGVPPPNDPPYDEEGHLNKGGDWDAYWRFRGNLSATTNATTHNTRNQLTAELAVRAVVWGKDLNCTSLNLEAFSDSGQITTAGFTQQNSGASLKFKVFGITISSGQKTFQTGTSFNFGPTFEDDFDLPPIHVWIFSITIGVHVEASVKLSGNVNPLTVGVFFEPEGHVAAHVEGGVDVGVASGTVSTEIDFIRATTAFRGSATTFLSTAPPAAPGGCKIGVNMAASGKLKLSTLNGKIELKAKFGSCPICYEDQWTLFNWTGVTLAEATMFDLGDTLSTDLPVDELCLVDLDVGIDAPSSGANVPWGIPFAVVSHATRPATPGTDATPIDCGHSPSYAGTYVWSGNDAEDQFLDPATGEPGPSTGCDPLVAFAPDAGSRTLTLSVMDEFGEANTKQVTFNVVAPPSGPNPFISAILPGVRNGVISGVDDYTVGVPICVSTLPIIHLMGGEYGGALPASFEWVVTRISDGYVQRFPAGTTTTNAAGNTVLTTFDWDLNQTGIQEGAYSVQLSTTDANHVTRIKTVILHFVFNAC